MKSLGVARPAYVLSHKTSPPHEEGLLTTRARLGRPKRGKDLRERV